eukprot:scaffold83119_cov31-Tisochrysis_lutea.AAC.1
MARPPSGRWRQPRSCGVEGEAWREPLLKEAAVLVNGLCDERVCVLGAFVHLKQLLSAERKDERVSELACAAGWSMRLGCMGGEHENREGRVRGGRREKGSVRGSSVSASISTRDSEISGQKRGTIRSSEVRALSLRESSCSSSIARSPAAEERE